MSKGEYKSIFDAFIIIYYYVCNGIKINCTFIFFIHSVIQLKVNMFFFKQLITVILLYVFKLLQSMIFCYRNFTL